MADASVSPSEVASLTERVRGVEAAVESIRKDIHSLVSKFDDRSRMPWGTILAGATLFWMIITSFVTIGGGVVAWGLFSQNAAIVASLNEFKTGYEADRLLARQDNDARIAEIKEALSRSVPREEHQRVWSGYDQRFADHQRQIDEQKNALGSTYSLRDYIQRLTERLDTIEERAIR